MQNLSNWEFMYVELKKKRGRPFGHKLSEESKNKIRQSRLGQDHSDKTRVKISKSLNKYFNSDEGKKRKVVMANESRNRMRARWKNFFESGEGCKFKEERSVLMKELWDCDCGKYRKLMSDNYRNSLKAMWKASKERKNQVGLE